MNDLWPWLLGGAGSALLVAAIVLNPIKALGLARAVGGFLLEKARAFVEWLRRDHNAWRFGFGLTAVGFALASFMAWEARRTIVIVREQCRAQVIAVESEKAHVAEIAEANTRAVQQCRTTLANEVQKRKDMEQAGRDAIARAEATEARAEQQEAEWRRRYNARPQTCDAALAEVEKQCASLSGF